MKELHDLIVIGQGAPNKLKDNRISRCVCAFSEKLGLLRLYPIPKKHLRRWDVFDATVVENPQDHRENTWKIYNSKKDWKRIYKWIRKKGVLAKNKREPLVKKLAKDNLGDLRSKRTSFGIIKPKILGFELVEQNKKTSIQTSLFDLDFHIINQKDFRFKPYVEYKCSAKCSCKKQEHRQQIVEWGCYEWMRQNPDSKEHCMKLLENLQLTNDEWEKYFLVGNIHKSPKTYVVIAVLRFKKK